MNLYLSAVAVSCLVGCSERTELELRAAASESLHASVDADLASLVIAARNLQAASPSRAWDPVTDGPAIETMRAAWKRTRAAYEQIEGVVAPQFTAIEATIDGRYDLHLAWLADGDDNLFDGTGVIGMHAIERILYAPLMRPAVIEYERALPGYRAAAYPASDDEAIAFKTQLVERLVEDASKLRVAWRSTPVDLAAAYVGLIELMYEQEDKLDLAASGEEESRYANLTMFDLRNNLEGTRALYELFRDWIRSRPGGDPDDDAIQRELAALAAHYAGRGDALPEVPLDWNPEQPTPANLATPFGSLWQALHEARDLERDGSLVAAMSRAGTRLGFPAFVAP